MTRKRAVKIIISATCDGCRNRANDLIMKYHETFPKHSNEEVCLQILFNIHRLAMEAGDFITMFRTLVAHRAIVGKVAMPLPEPPKGEAP